MTIDTDKNLLRRAHTDGSNTGRALLKSVTVEMAEQRLAAAGWFWSEDRADFVQVSDGPAS